MILTKTCLNPQCGGQRFTSLEPTEAEMTIRILADGRRQMQMPLPIICLDCGSTASNYQPLKDASC